MIDLFGSKWEREHGLEGGDKFYQWADKIEDMPKENLRRRFTAMEFKFKSDVALGKDIWPPSLAYFMALDGNPRVNEDAYKEYKPQIMPHTSEEYKEFGKKGIEALRNN